MNTLLLTCFFVLPPILLKIVEEGCMIRHALEQIKELLHSEFIEVDDRRILHLLQSQLIHLEVDTDIHHHYREVNDMYEKYHKTK
jgi:hypothetical protein